MTYQSQDPKIIGTRITILGATTFAPSGKTPLVFRMSSYAHQL